MSQPLPGRQPPARRRTASLLAAWSLALLGCEVRVVEPFGGPGSAGQGGAGQAGQGGEAGVAGQASGGAAGSAGARPGKLTGTTLAPDGALPLSGVLVYLTDEAPPPIADKVFCDGCVSLPAGATHALSSADGSFELQPSTEGPQYLVVQKGGFRRVRPLEVTASGGEIEAERTTLPPRTDRTKGDEVPRMTVVKGAYDEVEDSLLKLGIDPEAIELVASPLIGKAAGEFLRDADRVNGRHIVFLPCGDYTQPDPNVDLSKDPQIQDNLRAFVQSGGRLYVTDWHYDFVRRTFPGYITWKGASDMPCSGCLHTPYDAAAQVTDKGLNAWMSEQGVSNFLLSGSYTTIESLAPVTVETGGGVQKTVTPRVWVEGIQEVSGTHPATVSFEVGCGRVLVSTYHTEPLSTKLTPQARALLWVLLEVGVCNDSASGVIIK